MACGVRISAVLLTAMCTAAVIQHDVRQIMLTQVSLEQQLPLKGLSVKAVFSYDLNDPDGRTQKTWLTPIPYYAVTDTTTNPYTISQIGFRRAAKTFL